jgi:hypothetical protein
MNETVLPVHTVSREGSDYVCRCPHCGEVVTLRGVDAFELPGERKQHLLKARDKAYGCGGWLEVQAGVTFAQEMPPHRIAALVA